MYGVNRVILAGNLGKDPETRALPNGGIVSNFTLATNHRWKDPAGVTKEETQWHKVVGFGRTAELVRDYLRKGRPVYVEGRLRTSSWDDKEGKKQYKTEVIIDSLQFLGSGRAAENDNAAIDTPADDSQVGAPPPARPAQLQAPGAQTPPRVSRARPTGNEDIPF